MRWAVPSLAPAWMPALLFAGILLLQGCSLLPQKQDEETDTSAMPVLRAPRAQSGGGSFSVEVQAPDSVRDFLVRNLEIQRYKKLDDLGAVELSRLMVAAEANARELLNTLGYFTPTLTLEMQETPGWQDAARSDDHRRAGRTHARERCPDRFQRPDCRRRSSPTRAATPSAPAGRCARARPSTSRPGTTPRPPRCAA